jgi:Family of unknown function (DUF5329)
MSKLTGRRPHRLALARAALTVLALGIAGVCLAQPSANADKVKAEAAALVESLGNSGCEFQRNGSWYSADEARTHLNRKLAYMLERQPPASTEQFVELAASHSSMSGRPYLVRCPSKEAVPSRDWMLARLAQLRSGRPATAKY